MLSGIRRPGSSPRSAELWSTVGLDGRQVWMDHSDRVDVAADRRRYATCRCLQRSRKCGQLCRRLADECCRAPRSAECSSAIRSCRRCAEICDDVAGALSTSDRWVLARVGPMLDSAVTIAAECGYECDLLADICDLGPSCGEACRRFAVACLGLTSAFG